MPVSKTVTRISMVVAATVMVALFVFVARVAYDWIVPARNIVKRIETPSGTRSAILEYLQWGLAVSPLYQAVLITPPRGRTGSDTEVFRLEYDSHAEIVGIGWTDDHHLSIQMRGAAKRIVKFRPGVDDVTVTYSILTP